jgi:excisionase family DNA binding protein
VDIAGGTEPTPKLNQTLPFRERLGCSASEACAALGVGRTLLYALIAERRIEVRKLGRRTIISISSLLKLLDEQAAEPRPRRPGRPRKMATREGATLRAPPTPQALGDPSLPEARIRDQKIPHLSQQSFAASAARMRAPLRAQIKDKPPAEGARTGRMSRA